MRGIGDDLGMDLDCPAVPFTQTPNTKVPYNNRQRGEVAPLAMEQLRSYQERAIDWPMARHEHHSDTAMGRPCWCCTVCDPCETIWFINDPAGNIYTYTDDEILALKVAHIRQAHDKDQSNNGRRQD